MHEDIVACAAIVEKGDPDRFKATMAAPVALREILFPLYAFNVEVARAPWLTEEPMIAEMRLQWWRDALEEIRTGGGPVRRHEVATPLATIIDAYGAGLLDDLIAQRRWDIYKEPFENDEHLRLYLRVTAGNLLAVALRAVSSPNDELARQAGYAHGLANWLRAVPALEASGRIPLVDGRADAVRELAEGGLRSLTTARQGIAAVPQEARPVFLALWQAQAILKAAVKNPEKVAIGQLETSPMRQKLGLMRSTVFGL
ncbi:squalene/phytoene synthase family protein [Roseovarius sp. EL26]|uniref:phytoene/squalene synthase family protein n=1 Tax=Roseovarius sp. EL26 TaxID=2126672 RepID=UPI000EA2C1F2|nr:squalene/phytoene synthase family protein [Roseovarius sp. EL26]